MAPHSPHTLHGVDLATYQQVRDETEALAAPLSAEDQMIQSMPDASPTKWHRAHVTWFFETFLLIPHLPGYQPFDPAFQYLYNSYYEAVGDRHPRAQRGMVSRPASNEIAAYRAHVDDAMQRFIDTIATGRPNLADLVRLGLHHEQQHQELLLMDIKHMFSRNPLHPEYHELPTAADAANPALDWVGFDGGLVKIGYQGEGFHFDNEEPRHQVFLQPFELADRLVTNGDWLEFMADDGYHQVGNWLSEGWATITRENWEAPMYWEATSTGWHMQTLHGFVPVDPAEPVCHISYYEADAYARWAEARLPTEFEWEHAAAGAPIEGNLAPAVRFHPEAAGSSDGSLRQLFGDVWEWTSSSYGPYPGFRTAEGAVGEYNGKFMVNQYVLRGGCCATPGGHVRSTYRNFFPTHSRWMFSGLRLARDVS